MPVFKVTISNLINHWQSKKIRVFKIFFQILPPKSSKNFTIGPKSGGLFEFCTSAGLIKKSGGLLAPLDGYKIAKMMDLQICQ